MRSRNKSEISYLFPQGLSHAAPTSDYTYQTLLNADDENIEGGGEVKPVVVVQHLQRKYVTKKKKKKNKEEITKVRVVLLIKRDRSP